MSMMDKYVTPLLLVREVGTLLGKTRFQKLACLLVAESRRRGLGDLGMDFEIYLHGPYSRELSKTIEELVADGLLSEGMHSTPAGNLQYIYTLTPTGEELLENLTSRGVVRQALIESTQNVVESARYMPLPALIEHAYLAYEQLYPERGGS